MVASENKRGGMKDKRRGSSYRNGYLAFLLSTQLNSSPAILGMQLGYLGLKTTPQQQQQNNTFDSILLMKCLLKRKTRYSHEACCCLPTTPCLLHYMAGSLLGERGNWVLIKFLDVLPPWFVFWLMHSAWKGSSDIKRQGSQLWCKIL